MQDAIQHRVAQVHVAGDAMSILARSTRAPFGYSPARMRRNRSRFSSTERSRYGLLLPGLGQRAAHRPHLVGRRVIDIGLAGADQVLRPVVELLEIIRRMVEMLAPVEAEPVYVALDRVDVFLLLLHGLVSSKRRWQRPPIFLRHAEIQADRLGVADMQIAVRLGGKRVTTWITPPASISAWTMSRMKSRPTSVVAVLVAVIMELQG